MKTLLLCLLTVSVSAQTYQRWIFDQSHSVTNRAVAPGEVVEFYDRTENGNWKGNGCCNEGVAPVLTATYPDADHFSVISPGSVIVGPAAITGKSMYPGSVSNDQIPNTVVVFKTLVYPGAGAQVPVTGSSAIAVLEASNDLIIWTTQASVTVSNPPPSLFFRARIR